MFSVDGEKLLRKQKLKNGQVSCTYLMGSYIKWEVNTHLGNGLRSNKVSNYFDYSF